jgi:hypothetical protein
VTGPVIPSVDVGVVAYNTRELTVAALRRLLDNDQGTGCAFWSETTARRRETQPPSSLVGTVSRRIGEAHRIDSYLMSSHLTDTASLPVWLRFGRFPHASD